METQLITLFLSGAIFNKIKMFLYFISSTIKYRKIKKEIETYLCCNGYFLLSKYGKRKSFEFH